jgi:hypothetical protein
MQRRHFFPVSGLLLALAALGIGLATAEDPVGKPRQPPQWPTAGAESPRTELDQRPARTDLYGDALPPGALARMGTLRWRHGGNRPAGVSEDGKVIITAGRDVFV